MNKFLLKECFDGKSLLRACQNNEFKDIKLYGKVIDLGARDGSSSYYQYFDNQSKDLTYVDKHSSSPNVVNIDLEKKLNIKDKE